MTRCIANPIPRGRCCWSTMMRPSYACWPAPWVRAVSRWSRQAISTRRAHSRASTDPRYGVLDLKLGEENGLRLIPELHALVPDMRVLLLTGYASIATAVEAIKRGAHDYLAKPVDADAVVRALLDGEGPEVGDDEVPDAPEAPLALRRLEWEHIQRVLTECDGNISETARRLGMHRRTLQRKLSKHPVRERPERDD